MRYVALAVVGCLGCSVPVNGIEYDQPSDPIVSAPMPVYEASLPDAAPEMLRFLPEASTPLFEASTPIVEASTPLPEAASVLVQDAGVQAVPEASDDPDSAYFVDMSYCKTDAVPSTSCTGEIPFLVYDANTGGYFPCAGVSGPFKCPAGSKCDMMGYPGECVQP